MKIAVTGASGFVGQHVAKAFSREGWDVCLAQRSAGQSPYGSVVATGSIDASTNWKPALEGCDAVVHLAARAPFHTNDTSYENVNVGGTQSLVDACLAGSVRTLIFLSTLAVHGEHASSATIGDSSPIHPVGDYAKTKRRAEQIVEGFAHAGQTAVILRPPLIYGAGAKGNWQMLEKLVGSTLPLPLGAARNRRSMIHIDNLVSAIRQTIVNAAPEKSGSYIVADDVPVSLAAIVETVRKGMGRNGRNIPVPTALLSTPLRMLRKGSMADSLFGDLVLDGSRFRKTFDWSPPLAPEAALEKTGRDLAAARQPG